MRGSGSLPLSSAAALSLVLLPGALLSSSVLTGCGPALELIDQGILQPSGSLPFAVDDLPLAAQQTLEVTASVDGLIAETTLQLNRTDATFEGSLPFNIEANQAARVRVEIRAAFDALRPPVLLGWAEQDVELRSRDEVPVEIAAFTTAPIDDGGDAAIALDNRRLDLNRNNTSNLDDLLVGCDPDVPALAVRLSATDLQFPSGTAPGDFARQVIVLDSRRETNVSWWARVVGAPGAGIGPLLVDALVQPTPQPSLGSEADPNTLLGDDEALIAVTYAPTDTRISTGFVIVETLDACGVRQAGAVRVIGNPDGQLPSPLSPDAYAPIVAELQPLAAGLDLDDVDVNVEASSNLLTGQQLPLSAIAAGGDAPLLAGLPLRAAALVRVPAGTDVGVALVDLDADADLVIATLDDGALGELTVVSHPGVDPEAAALQRADEDRDLFVGVLDASVEGDTSESYALFFRAITVAAFDPDPIAPAVGPVAGGTTVTVAGRGFAPGATVRFAGQLAADVQVDADGTSLSAVTPAGTLIAGLNPATLTVTNPPVGQAEPQTATAPAAFTYAPNAPTIDRVEPPSVGVDAAATATVSVFGAGFTAFFGPVQVAFGEIGQPSPVEVTNVAVISETQLQVTVTRQAAADVPVSVRIQGPSGPLTAVLDDGFSVVPPLPAAPALTGITPASGPSNASIPVTVTGADFVAGAQVLFDDEPALTTFVDASSLTAITPPLDAGEVAVTVRNTDGQTSASSVTYVVFEANNEVPVLSAVSPTLVHAQVAGDVMTLFGQSLNSQPISAAVIQDGAGGETDLTVLSVVGAFVSVRVDGPLPSSTSLLARLTYEDGTEVTSPPFAAAPPAAYAAQVSTGIAAEGEDFTLVVAGDQLFPSQLTGASLTGPTSLAPTITSASEATVRLAVTGAVQGTYDLELTWAGGYAVTLTGAVAVAGDCGDGVKTPDEACDGTDFGADSCQARGFLGGQLSCTPSCDVEVGLCTSCGDDVRDGALGEACDGADLGGETCASLGYTEGTLACTALCSYDATGCSFCGDGIASGDETCDGVDVRGATCTGLGYDSGGPVTCRADCSALDVLACETCGDGVCTGTEDSASCAADCVGTCNDGNDTCDVGEDCSTCPTDCDLCAPYTAVIAGAGQSTTIGLAVPSPVTVTVTDEMGDPVPGATITFSHPPGGHTEGGTDNVSVTDAAGIATAVVHLGFGVGEQTIDVTGVGPAGVPIDGLPATLPFTAEDVPVGFVYTIANAPQQTGWNPHPSGSALLSPLYQPHGIAPHPDGGAVVAQVVADRVARITADGELALVAGNGDGNNFGGVGGLAVDAPLREPRAVAVADDGTILISVRGVAGQSQAHIARVDPVTGIYTVYAGNSPIAYPAEGNGRVATEARVEWATDMAIDPSTGDVLFSPGGGNQNVRRINGQTTVITEAIPHYVTCDVSGTGTFTSGNGMGVGPEGTVYIGAAVQLNGCSDGDERILAKLPDGRYVSTSETAAIAAAPNAIEVDPAGNIFAWAPGNAFALQRIDRLGRVTTVLGFNGQTDTGEYIPATDATGGAVNDLALLPNGDLWFTSNGSHNVRVIRGIAATGAEPLPSVTLTLETVEPITTTPLQPVPDPIQVSVEVSDGAPAEGMLVTAVGVEGHRVEQVAPRATSLERVEFFTYGALVPGVYAHEVRPRTREREVMLADVLTVDVETLPATSGLIYPAVNPTGVQQAASPIEESPTLQRIDRPRGIDTGPDGSLYVSDFGGNRIYRVFPNGRSTLFAGNGAGGGVAAELGDPLEQPIPNPYAVAVADDGDVFVATVESNTWRIYRIDADDGLIRLYAGGGASNADGITAISASLSNVYDLTWDPVLGRLYITDTDRIRYVDGSLIWSLTPDLANCSIGTVYAVEALPAAHLAATIALSCSGANPFSQGRSVFDIDVPGGTPAVERTDQITLAGGVSSGDSIAAAADGTLYVEVRDGLVRVDTDGTHTVLTGPATGLGTLGSALGPVMASPTTYVGDPISMAVGNDGTLYFAEDIYGRVRAFADPAGFTP